MGTNSSFTAAYRFHAWNPASRSNVGISCPIAMVITAWILRSVPQPGAAGHSHHLVLLIRPRRLGDRDQHEAEPRLAFPVFDELGESRRDHVTRTHLCAVHQL